MNRREQVPFHASDILLFQKILHTVGITCGHTRYTLLDLDQGFSVFILLIIQPDAQNLFNNKFISCLYTYRCDDTRGCIIQF